MIILCKRGGGGVSLLMTERGSYKWVINRIVCPYSRTPDIYYYCAGVAWGTCHAPLWAFVIMSCRIICPTSFSDPYNFHTPCQDPKWLLSLSGSNHLKRLNVLKMLLILVVYMKHDNSTEVRLYSETPSTWTPSVLRDKPYTWTPSVLREIPYPWTPSVLRDIPYT